MQRIGGQLCGPDKQPLTEVTRDELLWFLRTAQEGHHRWNTRVAATHYTYLVSAHEIAADCLPDMPDHQWVDTCNKSVPVYIMPGGRWLLLRVVLQNYIYRRWFRSYRSEIDHDRYICKFIYPYANYPKRETLCTRSTVSMSAIHDILSINQAICAKVETQRSFYVETYDLYADGSGRLNGRNPAHHIIQPLFRALLIVVSDEKYNKETSETVGNLPVYLVRTGIEEGLSAPISFEPIAAKILSHPKTGHVIEVTIETAIDFVMGLEAREAAAFGIRPDPTTDWDQYNYRIEDWKLTGETEPPVGPRSQWVDSEKYPPWIGDSQLYVRLEEQQFRLNAASERSRKDYEAQQAAAAESTADKKLMG